MKQLKGSEGGPTDLEDRCALEPGARAFGVYPAFVDWYRANGRAPLNAMNLSLRLQERGFRNGRSDRGRFFEGFRLEESA